MTSDHGVVQDGSTLDCLVDQCWLIAVQEPFLPQPNYTFPEISFGDEPAPPPTPAPTAAPTTAAPTTTAGTTAHHDDRVHHDHDHHRGGDRRGRRGRR